MCGCGARLECLYNMDQLEYFVRKEIELQKVPNNKQSVFENICEAGSIELIEYCLKNGCDINGIHPNRQTPLMLAALREDSIVLEYLISKGADVNKTNSKGESALMMSLYARNRDCFNALLKAGADPQHKAPGGYNLISIACGQGRWDFIDQLISLNVDVVTKDKDGKQAHDYLPVFGDSYKTKIVNLIQHQTV